jgi:membrane-associated phospholipid phosphatase
MACAYGVYNAVRAATRGDLETGLRQARKVIRLERKLRIDIEGAAQRFVDEHKLGMRFWGITYVASQVVALPLSIFLVYQFRRPAYPFVRNVSLFAWAGGLVWYAAQPVAPPRLVPREDGGLPDSVSEKTPIDLDSGFIRAFYNPIAAMPSLHVGMAPIVGGAFGMLLPRHLGRLVAVGYPLLITISVIVTGNHYVLDVVGGLAVVGPAAVIAALISGREGPAELHSGTRR